MKSRGGFARTAKEKAEAHAVFWEELFNRADPPPVDPADEKQCGTVPELEAIDEELTDDEIADALKKLRAGRAVDKGHDKRNVAGVGR